MLISMADGKTILSKEIEIMMIHGREIQSDRDNGSKGERHDQTGSYSDHCVVL